LGLGIDREKDIEELRRIAQALELQNKILIRTLEAKCRELAMLKGREGELQQTLALLNSLTKNATASSPPPKDDKNRRPKKPRDKAGPTEQPRLPIVEQLFELDAADRACPSCGGPLYPMEGQFETSEMIDLVEVEYRLVKVKQQKYVCRCGGCVETAPGPERAAVGGRYSLGFGVKVGLDKYLDHIPLARQERILDRHGLTVSSQTLWDQLFAMARRLRATNEALFAHVLAQPVIGLDQTSWPRLESEASKPWQMWCLTAPGAVVHRIRDDKSAATFLDLIGHYQGVVVCDALKTHEAGAREGPGILLAACWAHVFRKYEEAAADHPEAHRALEWIGKLYEIDRSAEGDLERLVKLRRGPSAAVLAEMKAWLPSQYVLRTLSIGNAAAYTEANWIRLTRFLDDPRIPLDNNATERGLRGPVVGRKNHYGSKSRNGTLVAATFYSLVETAKLHDVDPARYLTEAIRAADRSEILLPWQLPR
jgi:transposase